MAPSVLAQYMHEEHGKEDWAAFVIRALSHEFVAFGMNVWDGFKFTFLSPRTWCMMMLTFFFTVLCAPGRTPSAGLVDANCILWPRARERQTCVPFARLSSASYFLCLLSLIFCYVQCALSGR
jgi:hypothetical protein